MSMGFCAGPLLVDAAGARVPTWSRGLLPTFFGASPRARPRSAGVATRACAKGPAHDDDGLSGLERLRVAQREIASRRAQARGRRSSVGHVAGKANNQSSVTPAIRVGYEPGSNMSGHQATSVHRPPARTKGRAMSTRVAPIALTVTQSLPHSTLRNPTPPESGSVFILRGDGSLPRRGTSSEKNATTLERVLIPSLAELSLLEPIDPAVRSKACLPRVTSVLSSLAAKATLASFTQSSLRSASVQVGKDCLSILDPLNPPQRQAVVAEVGRPCLVFAGPGSGKTRVLTHRAAYLVKALGIHPAKILAVTFTNRAAGEMKERIASLLEGLDSFVSTDQMMVGTFHSICARFLRLYGVNTGIPSNFDILDSQDARAVVSGILKEMSPNDWSSEIAKEYAKQISMLKNDRVEDLKSNLPSRAYARVEELRRLYDDKMRSMNHLDFDDLLIETRKLLVESEDARNLLQSRFQHVLVDEWQDSNTVQYDIVKILAENHRNLFVVGDSDQSIYKFRGADARNVSRLGIDFKDTDTVGLDENYRSTACIVQAAQAVIQLNKNRPDKAMTTSNEFGSPITLSIADSCGDEAFGIAQRIKSLVKKGVVPKLSDIAIMYRVHSQSRSLEDACVRMNIPYRLIGGVRFYERLEIKDVLAYVRLVTNPLDDISLKRAINMPPRGIGEKTVQRLEDLARSKQVSMLSALDLLFTTSNDDIKNEARAMFRGSAIKRLESFFIVVEELRKSSKIEGFSPDQTISRVLECTSYLDFLAKREDHAAAASLYTERVRNIEELRSAAMQHESIESFLESVSLVSDVHEVTDLNGGVSRPDCVSMMTLHGGKGLEFACVFMCGMEEGLVPMLRDDKADSLEEERRLAYVGMTRAKRLLYFSWRERKLVHRAGQASFYAKAKPSRFLNDIPRALMIEERSKLSQTRSGTVSPNTARSSQWAKSSKSPRQSSASPPKQERRLITYGNPTEYAPAYEGRGNQRTLQHCEIGDKVRDLNFGPGVVVSSDFVSAGHRDSSIQVRFENGPTKWVSLSSVVVLSSSS
jgi:DNA helicase II / ATP-dependent DNA helicase PcrA